MNIIWLLFSGLWMAIGYCLAGIVFCIFIVTIPFGIASFRIASYALWPFGNTVIRRADAGAGSAVIRPLLPTRPPRSFPGSTGHQSSTNDNPGIAAGESDVTRNPDGIVHVAKPSMSSASLPRPRCADGSFGDIRSLQ